MCWRCTSSSPRWNTNTNTDERTKTKTKTDTETETVGVYLHLWQFFHKFDLRTTMLYICENHFQVTSSKYFYFPSCLAINFLFTFQRLSKRSLFTGLKASNHFGRPDMSAFLRFVQKKHSYVSWQKDKKIHKKRWRAKRQRAKNISVTSPG